MTSAVSEGISPGVYLQLRQMVEGRFGIQLGDKEVLVHGRLQGLARKKGFADVDAYIMATLSRGENNELSQLVDVLTTNHTHFHREAEHFSFLETKILPGLIRERREAKEHDIRIWCAAASRGQEPYTLAMILQEQLGGDADRWHADVLGTDISARSLEFARMGIYKPEDVARLPQARQSRWFKPADGGMQVVPQVRHKVLYRRLNLLRPAYPFKNRLDIVFCRNVMIYFDLPTRVNVVQRMAKVIAPGGWLFISLSETVPQDHGGWFSFVQPGIYRRSMRP